MNKINIVLVGAQLIFGVGVLMVSSPAMSKCPAGNPNCSQSTPAPLVAAGIPGVLALGGGYIAVRRRRRALRNQK